MPWSWINCPPLWAPLTFWMQGISYLRLSATEEAVGFIWTSARWYVGCPFSFNIVQYVARSASWRNDESRQRDGGIFGAARQVAKTACAELLRLLRWSWRTGRSGWEASPSALTGQRGQPAKKEKTQDFNPMSYSTLSHQGAPKSPRLLCTRHILQRHISRLKKRLMYIMMMQDPRKQALLPQWTPLPTLGISWWFILGILSGLEEGV